MLASRRCIDWLADSADFQCLAPPSDWPVSLPYNGLYSGVGKYSHALSQPDMVLVWKLLTVSEETKFTKVHCRGTSEKTLINKKSKTFKYEKGMWLTLKFHKAQSQTQMSTLSMAQSNYEGKLWRGVNKKNKQLKTFSIDYLKITLFSVVSENPVT